MSMWTYVNGNILINTYSHTETEQSIQTFLDSLPKTSGSERPCEYHVSILDGYNVSGYKDGKTFEYQTQYSVFDKKYIDRYIVCTENNYGKESVKELEFRYGDR